MPTVLAFRYARALADVVARTVPGIEAQAVDAQLGSFVDLLAASPALKTSGR